MRTIYFLLGVAALVAAVPNNPARAQLVPAFSFIDLTVKFQGPAAQAVAPPVGHAWCVFGNHTHTNYSVDASATIERRIRGAAAEGANALSVTDHGNMDVCNDPMFATLDGCVPMPGEEWGSDIDGDAGLLNPTIGPPIGGAALDDMIPQALARGATIIANHPFIASEPWTREDLNLGITGIEIVTTPVYVMSGYAAAIDWWHGFLAKGRIVFGIGGSDNHTDSPFSLQPVNHVLSSSTQPGDLQDAIEAGCLTISQSPAAGRCMAWCDADADGAFELPMGSNVPATQSKTITFRIEAFGAEGLNLVLFTKNGQAGSYIIGSGAPWVLDLEAQVAPASKDFLRAEIHRDDIAHPLESITNPIYVNYTPDDADSDGLLDAQELALGTNMYDPDTDHDGVGDGLEVVRFHSNPLDPDSNRNGYKDGVEAQWGYNPADPNTEFHLPLMNAAGHALIMALIAFVACRRARAA